MSKILYICVFVSVLSSCNLEKKDQGTQDCNRDFKVFFEKFSSDSLFQTEHVKYPFKESYVDGLEGTKIKTEIVNTPSEYDYVDLTKDKDAMNNEFGKYSVKVEKIDKESIYYRNIGYDNGINVLYKFKLIDGCWYLIEIVDRSV